MSPRTQSELSKKRSILRTTTATTTTTIVKAATTTTDTSTATGPLRRLQQRRPLLWRASYQTKVGDGALSVSFGASHTQATRANLEGPDTPYASTHHPDVRRRMTCTKMGILFLLLTATSCAVGAHHEPAKHAPDNNSNKRTTVGRCNTAPVDRAYRRVTSILIIHPHAHARADEALAAERLYSVRFQEHSTTSSKRPPSAAHTTTRRPCRHIPPNDALLLVMKPHLITSGLAPTNGSTV